MHNENRAPKLVRSKSVPIRSRPQEPPKKTVPVTPNVLKRSARLTTRRSERPVSQEKFKARPAQVLQRKPFCPAKLPKTAPTQVQPFNLLSENRLKERQEYNKRAATKTEAKLEKVTAIYWTIMLFQICNPIFKLFVFIAESTRGSNCAEAFKCSSEETDTIQG